MSVHKLTAGGGYTYLTRQVAASDATSRGRSGLSDYYTQKGETPGVWMGHGLTGLAAEALLFTDPDTPVVTSPGPGEGPTVGAGEGPGDPGTGARDASLHAGDSRRAPMPHFVLNTPPGGAAARLALRPLVAAGGEVTERQMQALFGQGLHPDASEITRVLNAEHAGELVIQAATELGTPYRVFDNADDFSVATARAFRAHNKARGLPGDTPVPEADRAAIRTAIARTMFYDEHGREPADARELSGHLARVSRQKTTAVAGYDFTFSPVKSVSVLWAVAPRDIAETVAAAHEEAVADTVTWLEEHAAYTRTGRDGVAQVDVRGLIATAFVHRDSRAGDPDLHTHVAVSNKVQTADGRWLALDGRAVYANVVAASEHYNTRLEALLVDRLGVSFADRANPEPGPASARRGAAAGTAGLATGAGAKRSVREIVGIDGDLPRLWSSRRSAIDVKRAELSAKFQADHGRPPSPKEAIALAQQANLATREDKHEPRSLAEQRAVWRTEALSVLGDDLALSQYLHAALGTAIAGEHARPYADEWALTTAREVVKTVQTTRSTWKERHVRAEAERAARRAGIALEDLERAVDTVTNRALHRMSIRLDPAPQTANQTGPAVQDAPAAAAMRTLPASDEPGLPATDVVSPQASAGTEEPATTVQLELLDSTLTPVALQHLQALEHAAAGAADGLLPGALRRSDGTSVYSVAGSALFTSTAVIEAEQRIHDAAERTDGATVDPAHVELALLESVANGVELNPGQAALVRSLATNPARVQLALAPAGTGKTTAMRVLARAWTTTPTSRPAARRVLGLAPSAAAASVLRDEISGTPDAPQLAPSPAPRGTEGYPAPADTEVTTAGSALGPAVSPVDQMVSTDTIAKLLHHVRDGSADTESGRNNAPAWLSDIDAGTLVIIDEAGMAGTVDLADTIDFLIARGATVRLVGDDQQLAAIGAGGVLRDLAHTHGAVTLSQVMRFTDRLTGAPNHSEGAASLALRDGDPAAIAYYTDHGRVHVGDLTTATDVAYTAWQTDQAHGLDSIMIAPTNDLVTGLNTRARDDRLAAAPAASHDASNAVTSPVADAVGPSGGAGGGAGEGPEVLLADGTRASAGDTVVTRKNNRRLAITATDWVKNGDRWTVTDVTGDGALQVLHARTGRRVTLPADYVASHVALGYASTVHAAQGVTADTCHTVVTGAETRQLLYVAMTRGRHANHVYLTTAGDGDEHTTVVPDTLLPPTAVDLLHRVLARDGAPVSAATTVRELADPATRLHQTAGSYYDSLVTAAEKILGPEAMNGIDRAAEHALRGLTTQPAWPTLRAHLALLELDGSPAPATLAQAITRRSLQDAGDVAAVLDWRLDPTGEHSHSRASGIGGGTGAAVPWLPGVPARAASDPEWGTYLRASAEHLSTAVDVVRARARGWTPTTAPSWALLLIGTTEDAPASPDAPHSTVNRPDEPASGPVREAGLVVDLAVWRAANGVPDTDLRPTGPPRLAAADVRAQERLDLRVAALLGRADVATSRWKPLAEHLNPHLTTDPYWPQLASQLSVAERAGIDITALVTTAAQASPLPDEQPAAALWWRLGAHLATGAAAATADSSTGTLRPDWTPQLADVVGARTAQRVLSDPAWPSLVAAVNLAQTAGWDPAQALSTAYDLLLDGQPDDDTLHPGELATALAWRVRLLTDATMPAAAAPARAARPASPQSRDVADLGNGAHDGAAATDVDPPDPTALGIVDDGTRDDDWLASLTPPDDEDDPAYTAPHDDQLPLDLGPLDPHPAPQPGLEPAAARAAEHHPTLRRPRGTSDTPAETKPEHTGPAAPAPAPAPRASGASGTRRPAPGLPRTPSEAASEDAASTRDGATAPPAPPLPADDPWAVPADFDYAAALTALTGTDTDTATATAQATAAGALDTDGRDSADPDEIDDPTDHGSHVGGTGGEPASTAPDAAPTVDDDDEQLSRDDPDTRPGDTSGGVTADADNRDGALFATAAQAAEDEVTRRELLRLNQLAADFYSEHYFDVWAPGYVHERLGTDLVDDPRFPLGYAPKGWTRLTDHLRRQGAHDHDLVAAGLAVTASNGRLIDRFRDRLIIPIRDGEEVHGFIARRNPEHDDTVHVDPEGREFNPAGPKYLNTADTLLFSKGREMFGPTENAAAIAAGATPTLVEGPLDAIAVTLAGGGDYVGVAPLGTALTSHQVGLLLPHIRAVDPTYGRPGLVVGTDNDRAGQTAAHRAFWQFAPHGITAATHLLIPEGKDPAGLLALRGPGALHHTLTTAPPLADTLITGRIDGHADRLQWAEGKVQTARAAAAVIATLPVEAWQGHVERLAVRTDVVPGVALLEVIDAAHIYDDDPYATAARNAAQRLPETTPLPATPLPSTVRWATLAEGTAPGVTTDPRWQWLADSLERAHAAGYDITRLPALAARYGTVPSDDAARHLTEVLVQACPDAADRSYQFSPGYGRRPPRTLRDREPPPRLPPTNSRPPGPQRPTP